MLGLSESEREKWAEEVLNRDKVVLYCADHSYGGKLEVPPARGCKKCWTVFYSLLLANTPPTKRAEKLAMLSEMVHKVCELVEKGQWDFSPFDHPQIHVEKDAELIN